VERGGRRRARRRTRRRRVRERGPQRGDPGLVARDRRGRGPPPPGVRGRSGRSRVERWVGRCARGLRALGESGRRERGCGREPVRGQRRRARGPRSGRRCDLPGHRRRRRGRRGCCGARRRGSGGQVGDV